MIDDVKIQMAEIKTDIKYIKKAQDENKEQYKELKGLITKFADKVDRQLDTKADKEEVKAIHEKLTRALVYVVLVLIGIVGFFIKYEFFN